MDPSRILPILEFVQRHEGDVESWLVGGCVRDWLLHRESNDVDLAVLRGAIRLARALADAFGGGFFVLDRERDVARAILSDLAGGTLNVDIARVRACELSVDLSLRDFTVNAMALPIGQVVRTWSGAFAQIVDPFGGRADLEQGVIRAVTESAFSDDPVRMLRALRQAMELRFRIEDATYNLVRRDAPLLETVAAERVRDELRQIIAAPGGWHEIGVLHSTGLLSYSLPEVASLVGVIQSAPHYQDVFDHTRSAMAHLEGLYGLIWPDGGWRFPQPGPPDSLPMLGGEGWADLAEVIRPYQSELRDHLSDPISAGRDRRDCLFWAVLAHDWGKPATRSVDESGRVRFLGHDARGATLAAARLRALRMAADEVAYVSRLVGTHMRPGQLSSDYPPSRRVVYRFFREAAGCGPDCVLLSLADYSAVRAGNRFLEPWPRRLATAGLLLESYFSERTQRVEPVPLLDGRQIMAAFGLGSGPQIGRLLEGLREAQAAGEVTTTEGALAWLEQQLERGGRR
jgi:tRNA nucleotidyltransferase/poly(A) polymerase